jgi:hypothetical protein
MPYRNNRGSFRKTAHGVHEMHASRVSFFKPRTLPAPPVDNSGLRGAPYLALAGILGVELLTSDTRLAEARWALPRTTPGRLSDRH